MGNGVRIDAHEGGFRVLLEGSDSNALVARRLVNQFSPDPPGDPAAVAVTYTVPRARLMATFLALTPHLVRTGIPLRKDEAAESVFTSLREETGALRAALEGKAPPIEFDLGENFARVLTPHQERCVARLLALPHGANFSVPGAGKTTITIAIHEALRLQGRVDLLVVIAPRNAFKPWEEEMAACLANPHPVVRLAGGTLRIRGLLAEELRPAVYLTSYQQAYYALDVLESWLAAQTCGVHLILDESHKVKNPRRGAWARTALRLASLASRRDILTGTPAPNALADLETQLEFLWPYQAIVSEADLRAPDAEETVTQRLSPLYVRITKKDLGLPPAVPEQVPVAMGEIQAEIYRRIRQRLVHELPRQLLPNDLRGFRIHAVRLLQLACNPALILADAQEFRVPPIEHDDELAELFEQYHEYEIPPKLTYAARAVAERAAMGKKTIVWSSFVRNLEMLSQLLSVHEPAVIHGGVPTALDMEEIPESSREAQIERFKTSPECAVLIANPAACSESISLHRECDFALYLDRTFNAASYLQSLDRIHRLGLPSDARVRYELLVSPGTVDEVVDRRLSEKIRRLGRLLDDESLSTVDLDTVDETSSLAFDLADAQAVIEHLSGQVEP